MRLSVLDAFVDAAMRFRMHDVACPEFRTDEKTFIGVIQAFWDREPAARPKDFEGGPYKDFSYFTWDVRKNCRVSISKHMIENGVKLAGPNGWISIRPDEAATMKMLVGLR